MRHQRSSQHFYTRVALRNSKTTSWSKVDGMGFHKKPGKWPIRRLALSTTFRLSQQLLLTRQPRFNLGLLAYWPACELGGSSCDSSIMLSVCRPVIILLQASKLVLQS